MIIYWNRTKYWRNKRTKSKLKENKNEIVNDLITQKQPLIEDKIDDLVFEGLTKPENEL